MRKHARVRAPPTCGEGKRKAVMQCKAHHPSNLLPKNAHISRSNHTMSGVPLNIDGSNHTITPSSPEVSNLQVQIPGFARQSGSYALVDSIHKGRSPRSDSCHADWHASALCKAVLSSCIKLRLLASSTSQPYENAQAPRDAVGVTW